MDASKEIKLSKSILDMKFMKRTKERVLKDQDDAEGTALYSSQITKEMKNTGNIIFNETSISNCKGLLDGRLSFGGMNPEIEKLMREDKRVIEAEKRKEVDLTDVEMTHYSSVVNTMANKFNNKRNRNKKKFIKPSDD